MRATYRFKSNKDYWAHRWSCVTADEPMANKKIYPLKYAEMTIKEKSSPILEAGCGAGRILRYYHEKGYNIEGIDFIDLAVNKLLKVDPTLRVSVGDIRNLNYANESFKYILAFGLYHNFESKPEITKAIAETRRILKSDGLVCASFRADNIQNRINDWVANKKDSIINGKDGPADRQTDRRRYFHKMNFTLNEFKSLFASNGFKIVSFWTVENMPLLYKFKFFRAPGHKSFDENKGRKEGYWLSNSGRKIQKFLVTIFPSQFCNVYVIIASKQ